MVLWDVALAPATDHEHLRGVSEDLRRPGRVYLPQIWMEQWSLTSTDLEDATPDAYLKAWNALCPWSKSNYEGSRPVAKRFLFGHVAPFDLPPTCAGRS